MVDTARISFPDNMTRAAYGPGGSTLESAAIDVIDRMKVYAKDEPVAFALWAFGIGFVLGWRLKPW